MGVSQRCTLTLPTSGSSRVISSCVIYYPGDVARTPYNCLVNGQNITLGSTTLGVQSTTYTFSPPLSGSAFTFNFQDGAGSNTIEVYQIQLFEPYALTTTGILSTGPVTIANNASVSGSLTLSSNIVNSSGNTLTLPTNAGLLGLAPSNFAGEWQTGTTSTTFSSRGITITQTDSAATLTFTTTGVYTTTIMVAGTVAATTQAAVAVAGTATTTAPLTGYVYNSQSSAQTCSSTVSVITQVGSSGQTLIISPTNLLPDRTCRSCARKWSKTC